MELQQSEPRRKVTAEKLVEIEARSQRTLVVMVGTLDLYSETGRHCRFQAEE